MNLPWKSGLIKCINWKLLRKIYKAVLNRKALKITSYRKPHSKSDRKIAKLHCMMSSFNLWVLLFQFVNDMPIKGLKRPLVCIAKSQSTTTTKAWLKESIETASLLKASTASPWDLSEVYSIDWNYSLKKWSSPFLAYAVPYYSVFFLSRNCSLPNLFTAKILLEGWPCLFCQIFFWWFWGTSRFELQDFSK